jgi:hypothetical protein
MKTGAKLMPRAGSAVSGIRRRGLFGAQVDRGLAAGLTVALQFEADLLAFREAPQLGAFDG